VTNTVDFIDQTIRDGQQSLWGMRMSQGQMMPVLPWLDEAGYRVVDFTGGAMFKVQTKNLKRDPWAMIREVTSAVTTPMRAAIRSDGILMGPAPDALMDLWTERLVANGIRSFWVFDVLLHEERFGRVVRLAKSLGVEVVGAIMFTDSPVHTDDYYADLARRIAKLPVDAIYLEDTAGVLTPERARTLVPAVQRGGGLPIEAHFHNTTGLAPICYVEALRAGVRTLHTAVPPMADRGSLPSITTMMRLVRQLGLEHNVGTAHLDPVREWLTYVGEREGFQLGGPTEFDLDVYQHQIPGGMMGTLKAQLAEVGLLDRLQEILEETGIVRRELGYPGMATPLSQFAGIQAVLNLLTGERYSKVPIEVIRYVCGYYGKPVGEIDPNVLDRVMDQPLAKAGVGDRIEQPSLTELRAAHGNVSDDDLILRATMSAEEVDEMRRSTVERAYPAPLSTLVRTLMHSGDGGTHASCRSDNVAVSLSAAAPAY
jgi:oxaloacetate decarboxylase (Na+ extruding) subunit alpha